ncbi:MAG: TIGR04283 family arsenosugar biosynthesis glycosyltransferase [Pseudomonadales bacterium]|nr:TIGR04283 family arsenosugar biosynthesis glycosyltransferase [Pseudomonadales bacterium]MCP5189023.1 TIGR04283 family arsenosugar biosynthesis glycosyltransferase [Pseudomonadales bacterium]
MVASIAFVIPVLNEQARIAPLLRELRSRFPASELIVVDGGSSDLSVVRAMPLCDQLLLGKPGRATQMNLGGNSASADYLCFLHADSLPSVTAERFQAYLERQPAWGFCRVSLSGRRPVFRVIAWGINLRSALTRVATGDQMLFVRRREFTCTGGFDAIPLMEDVAYSKRLRRLGRPLIVREPVRTSSRRWEERGVVRTILLMWGLRLAYFTGVSPDRLWRWYYGSPSR